jgi:5-methylcytosine-specific restriction endonuclease McrA
MGRDRFVKLTTLFPQQEPDECRVCSHPVQKPYRKYCSEYCKVVAKAVSDCFEWSIIRKWVLRRDDKVCQRCEGRADTVDHIIPVSKGGHPFDPDNLQALCQSCNSSKGTNAQDYRGETGGTRRKMHQQKGDVRQQLLSEVSDR